MTDRSSHTSVPTDLPTTTTRLLAHHLHVVNSVWLYTIVVYSCYRELTRFFFFLNACEVPNLKVTSLYSITMGFSHVLNYTEQMLIPITNLLTCACKPTSLQWAVRLTIFKKICSYLQEWFSLHYIVYVQFAFYKENNILFKYWIRFGTLSFIVIEKQEYCALAS